MANSNLHQPITQIILSGYSRVLSVRFQRALALKLGDLRYRTALFATGCVAAWPLVLNLLLPLRFPAWSLRSRVGVGWLVAYCLLNFGILGAAWWTWVLLVRAGPDIDEVLRRSPDRPEKIEAWLDRRLRLSLQLVVSALIAAIGVALFHLAVPGLKTAIEVRPMSYVTVAWTAFLGANVNYWLITAAELPIRMYRCRKVRLLPYSPGTTQAVIAGCGAWSFVALAVLLGVVTTEALAFLIPNKEASPLLEWLAIVFPLIALVEATYVAVQPFVTISFIVKRARRETLRRLESEIERLWSRGHSHPQLRAVLGLYWEVAKSPLLPISTSAGIQYCAALVAALAAYLLDRFL